MRGGPEAKIQRRIVNALEARWRGIELQGSMAGVYVGSKRLGYLMKLMGNRAFMSDIFVLEHGKDGEGGLCLEVKVPGKTLSAGQRNRLSKLWARGYGVACVHSVPEAMAAVAEYLDPAWRPVQPCEQLVFGRRVPDCLIPSGVKKSRGRKDSEVAGDVEWTLSELKGTRCNPPDRPPWKVRAEQKKRLAQPANALQMQRNAKKARVVVELLDD